MEIALLPVFQQSNGEEFLVLMLGCGASDGSAGCSVPALPGWFSYMFLKNCGRG